jgi:hypothetical protein
MYRFILTSSLFIALALGAVIPEGKIHHLQYHMSETYIGIVQLLPVDRESRSSVTLLPMMS